MTIRLFPVASRYGRMYMTEENPDGGGGGNPDTPPAFEMPEKFAGKSAEDIAKVYTDLERQYSEATKGTQQYSKLEQQLAEQGEILKKLAEGKQEKPLDDEQIKLQKEYYKNTLGLVDNDYVDSRLKAIQEQTLEAARFEGRIKLLEKQYDGSDGLPKFNAKEVAEYAIKEGLDKADPEKVYKEKYQSEIIDWHVKKSLKSQANPVPGSGKGSQAPTTKTITDFKTREEQEKYLEEKIQAKL